MTKHAIQRSQFAKIQHKNVSLIFLLWSRIFSKASLLLIEHWRDKVDLRS